MNETPKLNAALLKKVNRVALQNTQDNIGAFEFFFELVANQIKLEMNNPIHMFEPLLDPNKDMKETLTLYSDFHNSIIEAFNSFSEGKSQHHLIRNLFNLVKDTLSENLEDDYLLKSVLFAIMRPVMLFLETHNILINDVDKLTVAIDVKFALNEEFSEDITDLLKLNTLAQQKKLNSNNFTMSSTELVYMMIEDVIGLSVVFSELRKEYMPDENINSIQTDMLEIGESSTYNGINYDDVEKNDPCPCGSGKKYKKCCRKAWEYPISTLKPQKILAKPRLSINEIKEYYQLFNKLMVFVQNNYAYKNDKQCLKNIFEVQYNGTFAANYNLMKSGEIVDIIKHLSDNKNLVREFIETNKTQLNNEELKVFESWSNFLHTNFIIMQHHNNSEVFAWDNKEHKVYLVYGLYDPLASIIPRYPFLADIILLPFKGRIVFNGLLLGQDIEYGNNILRMFIDEYQDDIDTNGIILELK